LKKIFFYFFKVFKTPLHNSSQVSKIRKSDFFEKFGQPSKKEVRNHLCKNCKFLKENPTKNPLQVLGLNLYTKIFTQINEVCQNFFEGICPSFFVGIFLPLFYQLFAIFYTDKCKAFYILHPHRIQKLYIYRLAKMNAFLSWSHPFSRMSKSILAAFPEVIALASRAKPHDCGVWLGRDPDE